MASSKKASLSVKQQAERASRRGLLEELFYDVHRSRSQIYRINFIRGIFFGFGTVLGGTVVVALIVWLLGQFVDWFPFIGNFIQNIIDSMQR